MIPVGRDPPRACRQGLQEVVPTRVTCVIALLLVILSASSVVAQSFCYSSAGLSCPNMQISVCPHGDFEMIKNGCGGANDYIWVEIRDNANHPVPGIPWTDYWINACDPAQQLCLCVEAIVADSLTGANGRTTFSGFLKAGGCVLSGGIWIAVQGETIPADHVRCHPKLCLPIIFKGPDINGASGKPDCIVNLSDLIPFGTSYNLSLGQSGYNACCDYNDDNKCNLSDFARFGEHYQHQCM